MAEEVITNQPVLAIQPELENLQVDSEEEKEKEKEKQKRRDSSTDCCFNYDDTNDDVLCIFCFCKCISDFFQGIGTCTESCFEGCANCCSSCCEDGGDNNADADVGGCFDLCSEGGCGECGDCNCDCCSDS